MGQIHLNIPDDQEVAVKRIAAELNTSRSHVIRTILTKSLTPVSNAIAKEHRSDVRDVIKTTALAGRVSLR